MALGPQHPLTVTLGVLASEPALTRIQLGGLSEPEVGRFIEMSAGFTVPSLSRDVHRQTEGNPFFVTEIVRLLVAEGRLVDTHSSLRPAPVIPPSVRDAIQRRMQILSTACNRLLSLAAVVGRELEVRLLEEILRSARVSAIVPTNPHVSASDASLLDLLDEAAAARIIVELPGSAGRYRFAHALVRETLYDTLSSARRVQLHGAIAEALELVHRDTRDPPLAELAYHFFEATKAGADVDKAIVYARGAGDRAAALFASEDAILQYDRALQLLALTADPDEILRCDLLIALGAAQARALDRTPARVNFLAAATIARTHAEPVRFARAVAGAAEAGEAFGSADPASVALVEEALAAVGDRDCVERVQLLQALVSELYQGPMNAHAKQLADDALAVARRLDDPHALMFALNARRFAYSTPDALDEREACSRELLELALASGDPDWQLQAYSHLSTVAFERGDRDEFERCYAAEAKLLGHTQSTRFAYYHDVVTATRAMLDADWPEADRLANVAFVRAQNTFGQGVMQALGAQLSTIAVPRGQVEAIVAMAEATAPQGPQPGWKCLMAGLYSLVGRLDDARRLLREMCTNDFAALPWDLNWPPAMASLSVAAVVTEERDLAAQVYRALAPYPRRIIVVGEKVSLTGTTSDQLGILARLLGRSEEAALHLEESLALSERFGARYWNALTKVAYADILLDRSGPDDRARALALVNESLDFGHQTGSAYAVGIALPVKLRAQGVSSTDARSSIDAVAMAVEAERPDLRAHTAPDGTVTILFSDIEGFSAMSERLGIQRARALLNAHNAIMREKLQTHPRREFHVSEITSLGAAPVSSTARASAEQSTSADLGDAGEILDGEATTQYQRRLADVREELADAEANNDLGRSTQLREEMEFLIAELTSAGRGRRAASHAARARSAVGKRIRDALRQIEAVDPTLGRYLRATVRTGTFCSYTPDPRLRVECEP